MFSRLGFKSSQKADNYKCFDSTAQEELLKEIPFMLLFCPTQHFSSTCFHLPPMLPFPPLLHVSGSWYPFSIPSLLLLPSIFLFHVSLWVLLILHVPTLPWCWLVAKCSHCCCWHMAEKSQKNENQVCSKSTVQTGIPLTRPGSSPGVRDPQV